MFLKKLKRSIEGMPRPAYIILKAVLIIADLMLLGSLALFELAKISDMPALGHAAQLLLENPAGVLLLGMVALAFILDRS